MRYCHHCDAQVGPHADVCDECGGDLYEPPAEPDGDAEGETLEDVDPDAIADDAEDAGVVDDAEDAGVVDDEADVDDEGEAGFDEEDESAPEPEDDSIFDDASEDDVGDDSATAGAGGEEGDDDGDQGFVASLLAKFR
jgi:hypothetical protein